MRAELIIDAFGTGIWVKGGYDAFLAFGFMGVQLQPGVVWMVGCFFFE